MSRILIATLGSLGDLNPALMLGHALTAAGHQVRIAANPMHDAATRHQGLEFIPIGGHLDPIDFSSHARTNGIHDEGIAFVDQVNFTQLDALHDDLSVAAEHADVLLAAYHVVPAHLIAAKRDIPLLAYTLSPAYFIEQARMDGARAATPIPARWQVALAALRRRIGLQPRLFPYTAVLTDPVRMLGLFPKFLLGSDHAIPLRAVGYSQTERLKPTAAPDATLLAFCDERTVVFSFGTFVDHDDSKRMFEVSIAACRALGLKCLYLSRHVEQGAQGDDVLLRPFIDHAMVFPRVGVIVHHAGLGTLVAACVAGKPMVTVPFLYDQPYHAQRMAALIGAPIVPATEYDQTSLIDALRNASEHALEMKLALADLMLREDDGFLTVVREVAGLTQLA